MEKDASLKFVDKLDERKRTALHYAVERSFPDVVSYLLKKGAKPTLQDLNGMTPLHAALSTTVYKGIYKNRN